MINEGNGANAARAYFEATDGAGTYEQDGADAVMLLKTKADLDDFFSTLTSLEGSTVNKNNWCKYFHGEYSDFDNAQYSTINSKISSLGGPSCHSSTVAGQIKQKGTSAVQGFNWNFMDIP
jgi:hypothetical protein